MTMDTQQRYFAKLDSIDPMLSEFTQLKLQIQYHAEFMAEMFHGLELRLTQQILDLKKHVIELETILNQIREVQPVATRTAGGQAGT